MFAVVVVVIIVVIPNGVSIRLVQCVVAVVTIATIARSSIVSNLIGLLAPGYAIEGSNPRITASISVDSGVETINGVSWWARRPTPIVISSIAVISHWLNKWRRAMPA